LLQIPANNSGLVAFSNFGQSNRAGYFFTSDELGEINMSPSNFLEFTKIPNGSSTDCVEMRPSKATFRLRNLTPNMDKVTSCTVLVTSARPKVDGYTYHNNQPRTNPENIYDYKMMWAQLYARPEAKPYSYANGKEICLLPIDMVDYQSYKPPADYTAEDMARKTQATNTPDTSNAMTPMQIAYILFPAAPKAQTIEIEAYISIRSRYDMESPLSVMATGEFAPSLREQQLMQHIMAKVHNDSTLQHVVSLPKSKK
jgi:hypothetical protein